MKKTKLLAMGLITGLCSMGMGYAAWTQNFTVNQTVHTGSLKVEVMDEALATAITHFKVDGIYDGSYVALEKNKADTTGTYTFESSNPNKPLPYAFFSMTPAKNKESINFKIDNAYPGLTAIISVKLKNSGTVPVKLTKESVMFKGVGTNKSLADELLNNSDGISFENMDASFSEVGINETRTFSYEMKISSNMKNAMSNKALEYEFCIKADQNTEAK